MVAAAFVGAPAHDPPIRERAGHKGVSGRVPVDVERDEVSFEHLGRRGRIVSVDQFGASGPYQTVMEKLGLTAENVATQARALL